MMSNNVPSDQRSRNAIASEKDRNVFVQASAGTGKTTLMVDRVVELVKRGIPLDGLAVVTFTNPAASELRLRIRNRLRVESSAGNIECTEALKVFPSAWISTIHGFASRILKEFFGFTGVDPSFSTTETHFTPVEINREWDRWLLEIDKDTPGFDSNVLIDTDTGLQKEISLGMEKLRWLDSVEKVGGAAAAGRIFMKFMEEYEEAIESVLLTCSDSSDKLFIGGKAFLKGIRELKSNFPDHDSERLTGLYSLISAGKGKRDNWDDIDRAKQLLGGARDRLRSIGSVILSGRLTEQTWNFAGAFSRELLARWDRDRSRLSYSDLLYVAWKAVEGSDSLAESLNRKFRHILIDEFQDTSAEQAALFEAFLQRTGRFPNGCITVVADDKQSIYGWRNADIETYNDFRRKLEDSGALSETITTNFRSSRAIIRFVNSFGAKLFNNQTAEERPFGCEYSPILPREEAPEGCPVRILTLPEIPEGLKKSYNRNAYGALLQAEWFAGYLKEGLCSGAAPEDYALLYRSGTHLQHFIDVLERENIPYYVHSSRDFFNRPEISDLRELIRCLLFPGDRLAWISTLRSLFFGISDDSINRAIGSGTSGYLDSGSDCTAGVGEVNRQLRKFRESILTLPLADFLFELLFQTEMIPVLAALKYQESRRLGNIQYILEQTLSGEIQSPADLLRALDEKLAPARTEEPSTVPTEGGAVTLSTIHGAKGLSWKNVVLASLPDRNSGRSGKVISYDHLRIAAFDLGVPLDGSGKYRMKSPLWPEIKGIMQAREKAELRRLLYVAVTRPEDSLIVFATRVDRSNNSDGSVLWESLLSSTEDDPDCCVFDEILPVESFPESTASSIEIPGPESSPLSDDKALFEICPKPEDWQPRGADIGDCVHAVLEKIDFTAPEKWFSENEDYLEELYGQDFVEIRDLSLRLFRMKLPFDLDRSEIIGREYPYSVRTSRGVKNRYIDLLLLSEGKITVVDYKTDSFEGYSTERVAESYIETQKHYLRDISVLYGKQVQGFLVFLREGVVYPVQLD